MIKDITIKMIKKVFQLIGLELGRKTTLQKNALDLQKDLIKRKDPVIFDIGANIGGIAELYRELFPRALIQCFEPSPQTFQTLKENTVEDELIFCHELALSEERGTAVLNENLRPETNSLLATDERGASIFGEGKLDTVSQIKVSTTTIDTFCSEADIPHIDILKIDVQGAEYYVLMGARNMLKDHRISLIYTELILGPAYQGQRKLHEYLSLLDSFGYSFLDFFNQIRNQNQLIQTDILFINSSLQDELQT